MIFWSFQLPTDLSKTDFLSKSILITLNLWFTWITQRYPDFPLSRNYKLTLIQNREEKDDFKVDKNIIFFLNKIISNKIFIFLKKIK